MQCDDSRHGVLFAPFQMKAVTSLRKYVRKVERRRAIAWRFTSILVGLGLGAAVLLLAIGWVDHSYPELFGSFKETEAGGTDEIN